MNPMVEEALGSIIRSVLKIGAGYLVARGVWTPEAAGVYVSAAALAAVGFGWSYWTTYASRKKLVTALASPLRQSETEVERIIASGMPVPSVLTPAAVVPTAL